MKNILLTILMLWSAFSQAVIWEDISRINSENINKVFKVKSEFDVVEAINYAKENGSKIVISGTKHSQGGHILFPNAVLLDMSSFNKILDLNLNKKIIRVQSGAIWNDIQEKINPHRLSIAIMQSSNIFSVGGSLSANIHGRHTKAGPIIESVESIRAVLSSGEIVTASREFNSEIFHTIIGGYGAIGVILEVELRVIDDKMLVKSTRHVDYDSYISDLKANAHDIELHYGRCSFVKGDDFLKECYAIDYHPAENVPDNFELMDEKNIWRNTFLFNLSRDSNLGKDLRWYLQKKVGRYPRKHRNCVSE